MDHIEITKQTAARIKDVMGDNFKISVSNGALGGNNSFCFSFSGAVYTNNIVQNCPLWMHIWVHDIEQGTRQGKLSLESGYNRLFRKISAKDYQSLMDKLVAYFVKNKARFEEIYKTGRR